MLKSFHSETVNQKFFQYPASKEPMEICLWIWREYEQVHDKNIIMNSSTLNKHILFRTNEVL